MENQFIGKNLVYQRKLNGYTQEELSQKTQVTIRTIQRIEKDNVKPQLQTIKLLAIALNIEVKDLLNLEDPKQENIQKKWLLLLHSTPFLGFIIPLANILLPLFLWIHKREDHPVYNTHGIKIINFQISATILYLFSFIALITIEKWGFFFFISIIPIVILIMLLNLVKAINTQKCYYPLSLPFISNKKKANSIGLLFMMFTLFLCSASCSNTQFDDIQRLDGTDITKDSLTHKIEQLINDAKVHGLAVTIFDNGNAVFQKTFGYKNYDKKQPLTHESNIYGASYSKAVFGVLVMKLVEDGVIDLDTPLESYLPKKIYEYKPQTRWHDDYSALRKDSLYHKITARMCLSHTTGFKNYRFYETDKQLRVNAEPGTKYEYSGEGFIYLQVVLERITGKGLEELAQQKIFKPLQMNNSSYQWSQRFENDFAFGHNSKGNLYKKDKDNEPRGGGTLETTASDYTKFLEAVLQNKIISEASWDEIFKPQIRIHSLTQFGPNSLENTNKYDTLVLGYGLGWGVFQTPYGKGVFKEGHGNGFQHYSILFPKTGKGIMMMGNIDNSESIFKELLEVAIKDTYTPWEWQNYIPYNAN